MPNTWIPLSDGCRLAARLWLPADAETTPVPAILEYLPYRKNDATARRDALHHAYFAAHGYACVRVDMRGSGDADGILMDEYLRQEQDDALEVLAWIAAQPWCTGAIGLVGISWGGFNGLQIAARRPPQLGAVISLCSTDDRYADDVHYMGGCLLDTNVGWGTTMLAYNARPPDPAHVGDDWHALWLDRLERTPPWAPIWLDHQRRDAYWKHGSICEDYATITCPVYLVGGWADGYPNAIPRMLAGLGCPRKGLIGPWGHMYPELGVPGPAIGFLQECLRWWDQWLKGSETSIMREPMLRAWMQESVEPRAFQSVRPGHWVAESTWPSPAIESRRYALNSPASLALEATREQRLEYYGVQHAGLDAGARTTFGRAGDFPPDQRSEDGLALTFTSEALPERLEVLGYPSVTLALAADRPLALVAVRLCDVAPGGASTLISRGLLNLTHRESHEHPSRLEPGARYNVTVQLNVVGYAVPVGHRLRVAISPNYWPHAWPSPEPVTLSVFAGPHSFLSLPVRPPRSDDAALPAFGLPETGPPLEVQVLRKSTSTRTRCQELTTGVFELTTAVDDGHWRHVTTSLEYESASTTRYRIDGSDPLSAAIRCERTISVGRGSWQTKVEAWSELSSDLEAFHLVSGCDAYAGTEHVFSRTWTHVVPRDLV